jgi:hypothetical protein
MKFFRFFVPKFWAYFLVVTVEYSKVGTAKTQLVTQIISKNMRAFFRDVLCCKGRVICGMSSKIDGKIFYKKKMFDFFFTYSNESENLRRRLMIFYKVSFFYLSNEMATSVKTEAATLTFAIKLFIVQ